MAKSPGTFLKYSATLCLLTAFALCGELHAQTVDAVDIQDPITPVVAEYIIRSIDEAEQSDAECLVIRLDTPGGLDLAMRRIIKHMFASEVPVIVYVAPSGARAASAGALITMAAHIAAMAPGTNIGAAHPVNLGGGQMDDKMTEKVENDAAAYAESIAVKRSRNKEWAIKAVRESVSISEENALEKKVIDLVAADMQELVTAVNGTEVETAAGKVTLQTAGARINRKEMGIRENVLKALANPNIAYILLLLGLAGLYFELSNPGAIFPGVIGAVSLILAFYSLQSLSANYAGVLLILLGVVLFILELKITSFGLLTVGGIVSMLLGSLMLFQSSVPYLSVSLDVIFIAVGAVSLFFILVIWLVVKAQRTRPSTGTEGLVGSMGTAYTDIHHSGKVFVQGEYWDARSSDPVGSGARVRITGMDGMVLSVEEQK